MSDGSSSDSDAEFIDLTGNDNHHPDIDGHYNDAPDQEEISLGVDAHGEPISHIIYRPGGPMDVDNEESSSDDDQDSPEVEGSLFFGDDDDDDHNSNGDGDDGGRRGPPSPPSSDNPGSESDGSEDSDNHHDDDNDDQSQARQPYPGASNGGSLGGDDSGDGSSDEDSDDEDADHDPINDDDEEGNEEHGHKNPNADVLQVLEEESVAWPEWDGECLETCQPPWYSLARKFADYRNRFLFKRNELRECKRVNRRRVTGLNHLVTALKEAVREFYAANEANIQENERLVEENEALRSLLPEEELDDFPDPVRLRIEDMEASLPQEMRDRLPPDVKMYLRVWRRSSAKPRRTERVRTYHITTSLYLQNC
jgi:hypothetical protein